MSMYLVLILLVILVIFYIYSKRGISSELRESFRNEVSSDSAGIRSVDTSRISASEGFRQDFGDIYLQNPGETFGGILQYSDVANKKLNFGGSQNPQNYGQFAQQIAYDMNNTFDYDPATIQAVPDPDSYRLYEEPNGQFVGYMSPN